MVSTHFEPLAFNQVAVLNLFADQRTNVNRIVERNGVTTRSFER
jgi:hypothetical protein